MIYWKFLKKVVVEKDKSILSLRDEFFLDDNARSLFKIIKDNMLKNNIINEQDLSVICPNIKWQEINVTDSSVEVLKELILRKWSEQRLRKIFKDSISNSGKDIKFIIRDLYNGISEIYNAINSDGQYKLDDEWYVQFLKQKRFKLPWRCLNERLMGLTTGHLWVVLGRYKIGKTFFILKLALYLWQNGANILFASGEMAHTDILLRIASLLYGIRYDEILSGCNLDSNKLMLINQLPITLENSKTKFIVLGKDKCDINTIKALHSKTNFDVIFIDSFYRLGRANSEYERVNNVLDECLQLCSNACVVCTSQYNREGSKGSLNIVDPTQYVAYNLNILRLSDVVLGIYRDKNMTARGLACISLLVSRYSEPGMQFLVDWNFNNTQTLFCEIDANKVKGLEESIKNSKEEFKEVENVALG